MNKREYISFRSRVRSAIDYRVKDITLEANLYRQHGARYPAAVNAHEELIKLEEALSWLDQLEEDLFGA